MVTQAEARTGAPREKVQRATKDPAIEQKAPASYDLAVGNTFESTRVSPYKPDPFIESKGYGIVEEMLRRDPQLAIFLEFLKAGLVSGGVDVVRPEALPKSQEAECDRRIDDMKRNVASIRGSWREKLMRVMRLFEYGHSVTEIEFGMVDEEGGSQIAIVDLIDRDPSMFEFNQDKFGKLVGNGLVQFPNNRPHEILHDPFYFIIGSRDARFSNMRGRALLSTVYDSYYSRQVMKKSGNLAVNKYGGGLFVARVKTGTNRSKQEALLRKMEKAQQTGCIVIEGTKEETEFETVPFPAEGFAAIRSLYDMHSEDQSIGMMIPPLVWGLTKGTGSFARSHTELQVFLLLMASMQEFFDDLMTEQAFARLCMLRYGPGGPIPRHKLQPVDFGVIENIIKRYEACGAANLVPDPETVSKDVGIPVENLLPKPAAPSPFGFPGQPSPGDDGDGGGGNGNGGERPGFGNNAKMPRPDRDDVSRFDEPTTRKPFFKPSRKPNRIESRMDFDAMSEEADRILGSAEQEMAEALARARDGILEEIGEGNEPLA